LRDSLSTKINRHSKGKTTPQIDATTIEVTHKTNIQTTPFVPFQQTRHFKFALDAQVY